MLETRRAGGVRERIHNHYLKDAVWCARCRRRLIVMRGKSKTGDQQFYYFCRCRQPHYCDLPYLPIAKEERPEAARQTLMYLLNLL
jgi:hypothetical protein